MGPGSRMCWIQLLLVKLVVLSSWISLASASPMEVMSAPNVLRAGTTENIFVEIQDSTSQNDVNVQIVVKSFPTKQKILVSKSVILTKEKHYQDLVKIQIPTEDLSTDPDMKQYVYLQAQFPNRLLERAVLVSIQSGYIFIQTDKPIYTQDSKVYYRLFILTPGMQQIENRGQMENAVIIEIVTSDGLTVYSDNHERSGIVEGLFFLSRIVSYGLWKVVAKFRSNPQQTFVTEFEVKKYVLPSFEVKLTPSTPFYYTDSESLTVNIEAKYTFGKEVNGTAYAVFGVIDNGDKRRFPSSLQRVLIQRGAGVVTLMRDHITQTFPNIHDILGSSIYVAVSVLTDNGGQMVEEEMTTIKIVTSPYTIHFKRTPTYFKPGMIYDVTIEVVNHDGSPASGVAVVFDPGNLLSITSVNGIAKVNINAAGWTEAKSITAKTDDARLHPQRQASATMIAHPHETKSNKYLHISVDETEVEVGNSMRFYLFLRRPESQENDITYLILSRGQLVQHERFKARGAPVIAQMLRITKDMLPSFRIIAYYHTNSDEVVADSVWVDVKDSCMGSLKLETVRYPQSYGPRIVSLKITGDPGATVGLVAADKSVYVLNNKLHLTQKKIWDTVEKFDTSCTPGGGKDSAGVFYDAGLLLETSTDIRTPDRTDVKCPHSSRRKRSPRAMNFRSRLVSQYEGRQQRECCLDGLRSIPVSYTCERRSDYIVEGPACIKAFIHCCREMQRQRIQKEGTDLVTRRKRQIPSDDDDSYFERDEILRRYNFPKSWHWITTVLSPCPPENPNCESTSLENLVPLPGTITTWKFTGISLSTTHGICVSDPLEVTFQKAFFMDLQLPHSAVHGEQLEIKAILHNYHTDPITVRVELKEEPNLCSAAHNRGWYRQLVQVGAQTSQAVPFIIIPLRVGEVSVEVIASVKDLSLSDGVSKILQVVPAGILVRSVKTVLLNPGVGGNQEVTINSEIPLVNIDPNSPKNTIVSLAGEQMPPELKAVISGDSMDALIMEPSGSGETNMIGMTLPVIATVFLDKTNQWDVVGFRKRTEALQHINKGYINELAYRKTDGSFSAGTNDPGSTWLTAYVAKVFSMAAELIELQTNVICDAIKFLILKAQQPDGAFTEKGRVFHPEMTGDVYGTDSDASLTAFCLIALQKSRWICPSTVNMMSTSINRAVAKLEQRMPELTNTYAVAMASYALAAENKLNKDLLYKFADPDRFHWPVQKGEVYTLEATAYALLALVKAKAFEEAKLVVKWLIHQERLNGGFGSTQATMTVYQAIAEHWTNAKDTENNLMVNILLPGRLLPNIYQLNKDNQHVTRISKFEGINKDVKVTVTGTGKASLKMESQYYAHRQTLQTDCEKFSLTVLVLPVQISDDDQTYQLKIQVFHKDHTTATFSILEVGLPTGFRFNKNDLDSLSAGRDRIISKYDMVQSERRSLIIHLTKISNRQPEEVSFRIHQEIKVGILQPAAVSVYEYNDEQPCVKFYRPGRRGGHLTQLCTDDHCVCAEENCSMQKKNVRSGERTEKMCEVGTTFAYKVRLEEVSDGLSTDIYKMRIISVIKEDRIDLDPMGKLRSFIGQKHCKDAFDLKLNQMYLMMGSSRDIHKDGENYKYLLSEKTWIEYWPTMAECQNVQHRLTCIGIEETVSHSEIFGCEL